MLKTTLMCSPLLLGALYMGGVFGSASWSRDIDRPEQDVRTALSNLDITQQPGAPGTDPRLSGGVKPLIQMDQTAHAVTWRVMSGDKVAVTMTADLQPINAGKRTRILAHVERGDAPEQFVSPAFRSKAVTLGLFSTALNGELDHLTLPTTADVDGCADLTRRFDDGEFAPTARASKGFAQGLGQAAKSIMSVNAVYAERQRLGCDRLDGKGDGAFVPVRQQMQSADPASTPSEPKVNFTPGKPMIDPKPPGDRR